MLFLAAPQSRRQTGGAAVARLPPSMNCRRRCPSLKTFDRKNTTLPDQQGAPLFAGRAFFIAAGRSHVVFRAFCLHLIGQP